MTVMCNGENLFLVDGTLRDLQVARATANLLEKLHGQSQIKSAAVGVGAVISEMPGLVANAANLVFYDGENVHNFAARLDGTDQIVCGVFEHADQLKNGDQIKAVVSRRGDALYVHAIMHATRKEFYMPLNVWAGNGALLKHCMKVGLILGGIISALFFAVGYFKGAFTGAISGEKKSILLGLGLLGPLLLGILFELWTYRTIRNDGRAEAIFEVFGFPRPRDIDLTKVGRMNHDEKGWKFAWRADQMLQK